MKRFKTDPFWGIFLSLVSFASLLMACASPVPDDGRDSLPATPEATVVEERPLEVVTILAFGDSLTAGAGVDENKAYPAQLEAALLADGYAVEVINGGISGETTSGALTRIDWMLGVEPDIVIVETGGNDGLRGVELSETKGNIDEIVRRFDESGAVIVVAGLQIVQNLGEQYTAEFAEIYPAVAEEHGAILIPFFLEGVAADPDLNQPDFIHPTADGYAVVVAHISPFVQEALDQVEE